MRILRRKTLVGKGEERVGVPLRLAIQSWTDQAASAALILAAFAAGSLRQPARAALLEQMKPALTLQLGVR